MKLIGFLILQRLRCKICRNLRIISVCWRENYSTFCLTLRKERNHKFLNLTVTTIVKYCMNKMCKFICISHMVFLGYPYFGCKICQ